MRAVGINASQRAGPVTGGKCIQQAIFGNRQYIQRAIGSKGDINDVRQPGSIDLRRAAIDRDAVNNRAAHRKGKPVSVPT